MFGFLRSAKYRIGVEITADGAMIGAVLGRSGPLQVARSSSGLEDLLGQLPVKGSHLVIAPPRIYHISCIRNLDKVCLDSLRLRAEIFLPYNISEASFMWRDLGAQAAAVAIVPTKELMELGRQVHAFGPAGLWFEPVEFAHARLGPAVYVMDAEGGQLTLADKSEFMICRARTNYGLDLLNTSLSHWKGARPKVILGAPPEVVEITGIPVEPLAPEATAQELAASPAGQHRLHCV